jgi:multidrug efflux pump subunit AcrA (membrane-fusion protein)
MFLFIKKIKTHISKGVKNMKKWIITVIVVVVVGFVGYQWYASRTSAAQQVQTQIRTAVVQKGKLDVKISGSGTVQPVTSEDITSTINNNSIDEVLVTAGETVKKGADLITFTDGSDPITAPVDGVITTVSAVAGQRVTIGQVVAHLTNYSDLQTVVQVDELDIPKVKLNQPVTIKVNAYPDQAYTGKVSAIANEGTSTNGVSTFDVTVHFDKVDNLKVGMSTEASILTASKDNALYVPVDAVHSNNNGKFVLVTTGDANNQNAQTQRVEVKTGLANEDFVEITNGLTEGQEVMLPQLAVGNSSMNARMMQGGFGGFGGMGGMGRQLRTGGGYGGGNRQGGGSSSGRSGN